MSATTWRPSLGEHLLTDLPPSLVRKPFDDDPETTLGFAIFGGAWVFCRAAVFGRARRDRLAWFGEILRIELDANGVLDTIPDVLRELARHTILDLHAAPRSLLDYWLASEFPTVSWSDARFAAVASAKLPLATTAETANAAAVAGTALGATYPETVEYLWARAHDGLDANSWASAAMAGVRLAAPPETLSLADAEAAALSDVGTLVRGFYPHLLGPLGL